MLKKEQIENNKMEFLKLISQINIEGADTQGLVEYLDSSDFFTAPASTQYHCNYEGGLCFHSLNVYKNLLKLVEVFKDKVPAQDPNSLLIVGLLHDISKTNYYESFVVNKKIYDERGSKSDNIGKFDWFSENAFKVKDSKNRFLAGNHGFNSVIMVGKFIPLSLEENIAIYNHMLNQDDKANNYDMSAILNRYPLLTLLHLADMASTFIDERD